MMVIKRLLPFQVYVRPSKVEVHDEAIWGQAIYTLLPPDPIVILSDS